MDKIEEGQAQKKQRVETSSYEILIGRALAIPLLIAFFDIASNRIVLLKYHFFEFIWHRI